MRPFLAKDSPSQVTTYDLLSVICHHGTAGSKRSLHFLQIRAEMLMGNMFQRISKGVALSYHLFSCRVSFLTTTFFHGAAGGHYIAYCQNVINGQWYEFDDQYVTEVHETVVQNAEAYVLFYR